MDFALNNCWIHVQYGKWMQWNSFSIPLPWSHVAPVWQGADFCPTSRSLLPVRVRTLTQRTLVQSVLSASPSPLPCNTQGLGLKVKRDVRKSFFFPGGWGIVADIYRATSATTDQVSFSHLFLSVLSSLNPSPSWGQTRPWDRAGWRCPHHGI